MSIKKPVDWMHPIFDGVHRASLAEVLDEDQVETEMNKRLAWQRAMGLRPSALSNPPAAPEDWLERLDTRYDAAWEERTSGLRPEVRDALRRCRRKAQQDAGYSSGVLFTAPQAALDEHDDPLDPWNDDLWEAELSCRMTQEEWEAAWRQRRESQRAAGWAVCIEEEDASERMDDLFDPGVAYGNARRAADAARLAQQAAPLKMPHGIFSINDTTTTALACLAIIFAVIVLQLVTM